MQHVLDILSAGLFALAGAALVLLGIARWTRGPVHVPDRPDPAVLIFEGPDLIDASPSVRPLLNDGGAVKDLPSVLEFLAHGFGADLADRVAALPPDGQLRLTAVTAGTLEASADGARLRLALHQGAGATALDGLRLEAARHELTLFRTIAEAVPQPAWVLGPAGGIAWTNRAYRDLAHQVRGPDARSAETAGSAPLFPSVKRTPEANTPPERVALSVEGRNEPLWFEVTAIPHGGGTVHFASDVSALVLAESARLHFVQALAKTFADLVTGLAIFDRQRRLVLFNPAFMDLTGLPIDFLSSRPLVHSVLDRLRETEMLPEPRDYAAWRKEVAELEAAAARGAYDDIWNLPGGRTYRVTGRPHPDGALALLFEDISGEVGRVRHLRAELDVTRAALEALEEPAAVFSAAPRLSLFNAAYSELWGPPPTTADLLSELARWRSSCLLPTTWDRLADDAPRTPRTELLQRRDGRILRLRLAPLLHGARLATFRAVPDGPAKAGLVDLDASASYQPGPAVSTELGKMPDTDPQTMEEV